MQAGSVLKTDFILPGLLIQHKAGIHINYIIKSKTLITM